MSSWSSGVHDWSSKQYKAVIMFASKIFSMALISETSTSVPVKCITRSFIYFDIAGNSTFWLRNNKAARCSVVRSSPLLVPRLMHLPYSRLGHVALRDLEIVCDFTVTTVRGSSSFIVALDLQLCWMLLFFSFASLRRRPRTSNLEQCRPYDSMGRRM